mgnify:CR=1 FL=1
MRTEKQKIECLSRAIKNAKEHVQAGDPPRVYSQYIRYALDDFARLNFFMSHEAHGLSRKDVIYDHVVPHSFVMSKLLSIDPLSNEAIMDVLKKYFFICVISRREDELLTAAGLRSKMPDGWDEESGSIFARYEAVGINNVERHDARAGESSK